MVPSAGLFKLMPYINPFLIDGVLSSVQMLFWPWPSAELLSSFYLLLVFILFYYM